MKIIEKGREKPVEVYAIYWVNNPALKMHGRRIHLIIPYEGFGGLMTVNEDDCEVFDARIDGFVLKKDDYGGDILLHWAVEKDNLINALIEHDPRAIDELHRRLRASDIDAK